MRMAERGHDNVVTMPEDFDVFYQREFKPVVALAYALSGSRIAAEDLAQEAFIAAHQQWEKVGRYESPGAWVRRVVSNKSISLFRKRTSEAKALTRIAMQRQAPLPELAAPDDELWQMVRDLPRRQSQAVALHYLEELAHGVSGFGGLLGVLVAIAFNGVLGVIAGGIIVGAESLIRRMLPGKPSAGEGT